MKYKEVRITYECDICERQIRPMNHPKKENYTLTRGLELECGGFRGIFGKVGKRKRMHLCPWCVQQIVEKSRERWNEEIKKERENAYSKKDR